MYKKFKSKFSHRKLLLSASSTISYKHIINEFCKNDFYFIFPNNSDENSDDLVLEDISDY